MTAVFHAWQNAPLRGLADDTVVAGRLQAKASLSLADLANVGDTRNRDAPFELLGPGDVQQLAYGVITRRYPAPGAADAEETKAALVEFKHADMLDLPWRYSPEVDHGGHLRPWLVLVVGADGELTLESDGTVTLGPSVQQAHKLADSWQWAHVHDIDGTSIARILCPRDFESNTRYTACLVPAFIVDDDGTLHDAWPQAGAPVRLRCYDRWTFSTGPDGDFLTLATLLRAVMPEALGSDFGTAKIRYDRRDSGAPSSAMLDAAGALQRPMAAVLPEVDPWIAAEVAALAEPIATPDGRWVLTAPRYHESFMPANAAAVAGGWSGELQDDPRHRGSAGLGAWAAIAWQDTIADAAAIKAGDLAIARDRIGHLALGLEASRSLWRRRVPADPVARLAVLAPVLARLPAAGGGTVLDAVAGRTPFFARALWSSAARRALRPGPARSYWAQAGASQFGAILRYAAVCPRPTVDPDVITPRGNVDPEARRQAIEQAILAAGQRDPAFAKEVAGRMLRDGAVPNPGLLAAILALLSSGGRGPIDRDAVLQLLDRGVAPQPLEPTDLDDALAGLAQLRHRQRPCRPVDLDALGRAVAAAVDPTVARPVVVDRVLGTLTGVKDIGPVELEPELDLPLWKFLSDASPDWLLPGIGALPEHRVVGLGTNPPFVEAMLVGANGQTLNELRFRNLPLTTRWSPLRKFWQRAGGAFDINAIRTWPDVSALGGAGLQPAGLGIEAVVAFRSRLFRRYPATVVYLYEKALNWLTPPDDMPGAKIFPTFTGNIGDDVTFFGFPVAPAALLDHWVVLEEPPSGYRFYTEKNGDPLVVGNNAADYAKNRFALPVRVLIGALLESA